MTDIAGCMNSPNPWRVPIERKSTAHAARRARSARDEYFI
jgi:hypothetical protein